MPLSCLCLLHGVIEGTLGHKLYVFVDGEFEVAAGFGVVLARSQDLAARVDGSVHEARAPVERAVEFLFKAAEAIVVDAHVTQSLRGELVVRVEALKLFLEVDALHIEGSDAGRDAGGNAARDPGEIAAGIQAGGDLIRRGSRVLGIDVHDGGKSARGGRFVGDLAGIGVDGVYKDGHRQLAHVAVIQDAAPRGYLKGALLLLCCALDEVLMAHDLKPEEAPGDSAGPNEEDEADEPEARPHERDDARGGTASADGLNGWRRHSFKSPLRHD